MDSFWSGVVAAFIGALIGGAFAALAAWIQVRGSLKVAQQLQADERRHSAALYYLEQLGDIYKGAHELIELHRHKPNDDGSCPKPDAIPASLMAALRQWRRTEATRAWLIPVLSFGLRTEVEDVLNDIVEIEESSIRSGYEEDAKHCVYFTAGFVLDSLIDRCRQELVSL